MKLVFNIEIKAAPEQVFYWIERPERAKQWVMNVSRSEYINETPNRVGTTFREYVEEGGQGIEVTNNGKSRATLRRLSSTVILFILGKNTNGILTQIEGIRNKT